MSLDEFIERAKSLTPPDPGAAALSERARVATPLPEVAPFNRDTFARGLRSSPTMGASAQTGTPGAAPPFVPGQPTLQRPRPKTLAERMGEAGFGVDGFATAEENRLVALTTGEPSDIGLILNKTRPGEQFDVRRERTTGRIVVRRAGEEQFHAYNKPGIDPGDFAKAPRAIANLSAEVAAGIAGFGVGSFFGAAPGGIIGAAAGEAGASYMTRTFALKKGRELEVNDLSDDEIHDIAFREAGFTAMGAAALPAVAKMLRLAGAPVPRSIRKVIDVKELQRVDDMIASDPGLRQVGVTVSQGFRALAARNPDEIFKTDVDLLEQSEALIATTRRGKKLRDFGQAQETFTRRQLQAVREAHGAGGTPDPTQIGEAVQGRVQARLEDAVRTADQAFAAVPSPGRVADGRFELSGINEIGERLRSTFVAEKRAVLDEVGAKYEALRAEFGNIAGRVPQIGERVDALIGEFDDAIVRRLVSSDMAMLNEIARGSVRKVKRVGVVEPPRGMEQGALLGAVEETVPADRTVVGLSRDISTLKEERRLVAAGMPGANAKQKRLLDELIAVTEDARSDLLERSNPRFAQLVHALDAEYATARRAFDRGAVGAYLRTVGPDGDQQFAQTADQWLNLLLRDPQLTKQLVRTFNDPTLIERPAMVAAQQDLRNAVFRAYRNIVSDADGKFDPDKAEAAVRWISGGSPIGPGGAAGSDSRRASLQAILGADGVELLEQPARAIRAITQRASRQQRLLRGLNSGIDGEDLLNWDMSRVVPNVWSDSNIATLKRNIDVIRKDPELFADFKAASLNHLLENKHRVLVPDATGRVVWNVHAMRDMLNPRTNATTVDGMRRVFGQPFIDDLAGVLQLVSDTQAVQGSGDVAVSEAANAFALSPTLRGLWAFSRVAAAPLSPKGRALSAAMGMRVIAARDVLVNAFADPAELHRLMQFRRLPTSHTAFFAVVGGLGGQALFDPVSEDTRQAIARRGERTVSGP